MTDRLIDTLPLAVIAAGLGLFLAACLGTGRIRGRGADLRRQDNPIAYWAFISLLGLMIAAVLGVAAMGLLSR